MGENLPYYAQRELTAMTEALGRALHRVDFSAYDLLIGDDTSGRIPALVTRNLANRFRRSLGKTGIPLLFLQGRYDYTDAPSTPRSAQDARQLDLLGSAPRKPRRALVITEFIETGSHLRQLGTELAARGIPFDVLTLGSWSNVQEMRMMIPQLEPDGTVFSGGNQLILHGYAALTGLDSDKDASPQVLSTPEVRNAVAAIRGMVGELADDTLSTMARLRGVVNVRLKERPRAPGDYADLRYFTKPGRGPGGRPDRGL